MILCGTDFSPHAKRAVDVSAAFASALAEPLTLVHAFDIQSSRQVLAAAQEALLETVRGDLHEEAERVRQQGIEVREELLFARPDEGLVEHARQLDASLVVVSSIGWRSEDRWRLGSVAERTVQHCDQPVLVVRDDGPFLQWSRGERALKVMIAFAFTETSDRAIRWIELLRKIQTCEVAAAHVFWPQESDQDATEPGEEARAMVRSIEQHLQRLGKTDIGIEVVMNASSPAAALLEAAEGNRIDLLVIGERKTRQQTVIWQGSIPYALLHLAPVSVAVIPRE